MVILQKDLSSRVVQVENSIFSAHTSLLNAILYLPPWSVSADKACVRQRKIVVFLLFIFYAQPHIWMILGHWNWNMSHDRHFWCVCVFFAEAEEIHTFNCTWDYSANSAQAKVDLFLECITLTKVQQLKCFESCHRGGFQQTDRAIERGREILILLKLYPCTFWSCWPTLKKKRKRKKKVILKTLW